MRFTFFLNGCERAQTRARRDQRVGAIYAPVRDDAVDDRRCAMHSGDDRLLRIIELGVERARGMLNGIDVLHVFVERAVLPLRDHQHHDHLHTWARAAPS
jgi:hypothetical protein